MRREIAVTTAVRGWIRSTSGRRWIRYSSVSLVSVAVGQVALTVCFGVFGMAARPSNLLAFVVGAVPSYSLNRRWTWGRSGRSRVLREIVPFWGLAAAGLVLSTWAVGAVEGLVTSATTARAVQTAVVMSASLVAYGVVWVAKFVAFDRVMFARRDSHDTHALPSQPT